MNQVSRGSSVVECFRLQSVETFSHRRQSQGKTFLKLTHKGSQFSDSSCLAAVLQSGDSNRPVLLIINNYTGDRLNFGLAVEMAQNVHNYKNVKLLIVDDDCSIDNPRHSTGRRGLAGIHLVNKIAGAMSDTGFSLTEVHDFCADLLIKRLIRTVGFSFHHDKSNELSGIEIGYGIHGEPGSIKIERAKNFKSIIHILIEKLRLNDVKVDAVILFNNLGGASEFIFNEFVREFIELVSGLSLRIIRVYAGTYLTSLCKEALSVTVMEVRDAKVMKYLAHPINTPAGHLFNSPFELCNPNVIDFHIPETAHRQSSEAHVTKAESEMTKVIIEKACEAAIAMKQYLNKVDGELGDGDTGSTLSRGSEAVLSKLNERKLNVDNPYELLLQISSVLMESMGGTSGAIFSIFFQCVSKAFLLKNQHLIDSWTNGISLGIDGIMRHGKSNIGDRTLLDSLNAGYQAAMNDRKTTSTLKKLESFAEGCRQGAASTTTMSPKSGRSSYSLSDKGLDFQFNSDSPDPGAHAVYILSDAIVKAFAESSAQTF